jgi:hypothetical protein
MSADAVEPLYLTYSTTVAVAVDLEAKCIRSVTVDDVNVEPLEFQEGEPDDVTAAFAIADDSSWPAWDFGAGPAVAGERSMEQVLAAESNQDPGEDWPERPGKAILADLQELIVANQHEYPHGSIRALEAAAKRSDALIAIRDVMYGPEYGHPDREWTPDTLDDIAEIVRAALPD